MIFMNLDNIYGSKNPIASTLVELEERTCNYFVQERGKATVFENSMINHTELVFAI